MFHRARRAAAVVVAGVLLATLAGCSFLDPHTVPRPESTHAAHSRKPSGTASPDGAVLTDSPSPSPSDTPAPVASGVAPTTPADPAQSHLATAGPEATPSPAPYIAAIPPGTVVSSGDVASPKGSIHFHYAMVVDSDGTYSAEYSGFTSTVPVPISVTLIDIAPRVGDGLTYLGVGAHQLGGPTTAPAAGSTAPLGTTQPGYLTSLVTYSSVSASAASGVPVELGPDKVLAVTPLQWSIPARQTNVHPVDGGARQFASGSVSERTASGAPKHYVVAPGDTTAMVAARFGISVEDLIWLNAGLEVFGAQQYLYEGTTINLDPQSR